MIKTFKYNQPDIDQLFTKNYDTPWVATKYIKKDLLTLQSGEGLNVESSLKFAKKVLEVAPQVIKAVDSFTFGPIGTSISNTLSEYYNKNPEWKPGFSGERHTVLPTSYGLTRANYAGPGTNLRTRLKRGDKGVDGPAGIDTAAKRHDMLYAMAQTPSDIRKADDIFIRDVKNSTQGSLTKKAVIGAIKAKNFGEDIGLVRKDLFIGTGKKRKKKLYEPRFKYIKDNRKGKLLPAQILKKIRKRR